MKEGFQVLVYTSDDPIMARRLKEAGAASVMPAGSPIGSGQGVLNPNNIRIILEYLKDGDPDYPVIVDAGVGTASDVAIAMELGCDGVLLNTGIAHAQDPLRMAYAMQYACEAGRLAYLAGRIPTQAVRARRRARWRGGWGRRNEKPLLPDDRRNSEGGGGSMKERLPIWFQAAGLSLVSSIFLATFCWVWWLEETALNNSCKYGIEDATKNILYRWMPAAILWLGAALRLMVCLLQTHSKFGGDGSLLARRLTRIACAPDRCFGDVSHPAESSRRKRCVCIHFAPAGTATAGAGMMAPTTSELNDLFID